MIRDKVDRDIILGILGEMTGGEVEGFRNLRKLVVDLNLTEVVENTGDSLFLTLYLAKKLTADAWENLATDASFNLNEEDLEDFTRNLGKVLSNLLEDAEGPQFITGLADTVKWLYKYFYEISSNPEKVLKQGRGNGIAKLHI